MKSQNLLRTVLATTAIVSLFAFANIANAAPKCGGKGKHSQMSEVEKAECMEKRLNKMASKLGLDESQKAQLKALKQTSKNDIKPLRDELRALRKEIRQLDPNTSDYAARLADAANRKAELTRQLTIAKGNSRQQMATILTPEQLAKKKEMRKKRKARYHKRKHRKNYSE